MCDTENQIHQICLFYLSRFLFSLLPTQLWTAAPNYLEISKGSPENVYEQELRVGSVWSQSIFSYDTIWTSNQVCPHSDKPETPLT